MSLAEQIARAKVDYDNVYEAGFANGHAQGEEAGADSAYNEFWDNFQQNGTPRPYDHAFRYGTGWDGTTLKPKYPLVPTSAQYMFYSNKSIPILPCAIDTSQCGNMTYSFSNTGFIELPIIDLRGVLPSTRTVSIFGASRQLVRIEKVYLNGGNLEDTFHQMEALQEIRFEGEFVTDTNFQWSPLSVASIESVVAALADNATGKTLTLKQSAVNAAFTTEEWEALVATKPNWTITLSA